MESSLPSWLSSTSLTNILKANVGSYEYKSVRIENEKGSTEGDHYLSDIIRLKVAVEMVNGEEKSVSFIVKDVSGANEFLEAVKGIDKEVGLYTDVAPYINRLLPQRVVPECYFISSKGDLLLEDLSVSGHKMADRMQLLDYDHCEVVLKTVAMFHAATAKVHDISPRTLATIGQETSYTEEENNLNYGYARGMIRSFLEFAEGRPEWEEYLAPVGKFLSEFQELIFAAVNTRRGFGVLNHGDLWATNILFKYHEGHVISAKLIDFQFTRYTSPAFDLHVFIATSMRPEVREEHLDKLLNVYLETLNSTLELAGLSQKLSKAQLDNMMDDTAAIGLLYTFILVPISLCDPKDPINLKIMTKEDFIEGMKNKNPYKKVFAQKAFQNQFASLINFYRKKGYF